LDAKENGEHIPLAKKNSMSRVMKKHHEDWLLGKELPPIQFQKNRPSIAKKAKTTKKKPTYA
jgi:hypothetical protein